jgi:hypothetical protein
MGGGNSRYVDDQERFVRDNYEQYKKVVPERIGRLQLEGKLRQLYASSDCVPENRNSYILGHDWADVKKRVQPIYASRAEANGLRRY